ncbi:MAG TPA: hypothetical protein VGI28_03635, partial [Stellaceae bacterium]
FWVGAFAELDGLLARPLTAEDERFLATRSRILARRNPAKLIREAVEAERVSRVLDALGVR